MTPSLPIPTDNIYKFACLFGLALIVVSIFSYVSTYTSTLDRKVKYMEVIIPLEAKAERNKGENDLLELNKKLIEVSKSNERSATTMMETALVMGIVLSLFGAYNWYEKIHKRDEKLAQLQIEKLEAEVAKIRAELANLNSNSPESRA